MSLDSSVSTIKNILRNVRDVFEMADETRKAEIVKYISKTQFSHLAPKILRISESECARLLAYDPNPHLVLIYPSTDFVVKSPDRPDVVILKK